MNNNRVFSSLSYFSIFFAGFIFPLAVYFIVKDDEVKYHAKRALVSHILPFLTIIILLIGILGGSTGSIVSSFFIFFLINIIIVIWNVIQGIKILM